MTPSETRAVLGLGQRLRQPQAHAQAGAAAAFGERLEDQRAFFDRNAFSVVLNGKARGLGREDLDPHLAAIGLVAAALDPTLALEPIDQPGDRAGGDREQVLSVPVAPPACGRA